MWSEKYECMTYVHWGQETRAKAGHLSVGTAIYPPGGGTVVPGR